MKPSRGNSNRRWTLMFIGDHGKVIELKHIRWLIGGTLAILLAAVLAAAVLFVLNQKLSRTSKTLRDRLETVQVEMKKVRQQTELLMAQLAVAQVRAGEGAPPPAAAEPGSTDADAENPQTDGAPFSDDAEEEGPAGAGDPSESSYSPPGASERGPGEGAPEPSPEPEVEPASVAPPAGDDTAEPAAPAGESPGGVIVEIDNLTVSAPQGSGTLKLEFKLRNVSPKPRRIEGRAMAILRGDNLSADRWITIPTVELVEGRPAEQKGYRFAINNWRTMRLRTDFSGSIEPYNLVEIYVFSDEGEIWLREVHPVAQQ